MSANATVTNASAFKRGSLGLQLVLTIVTVGFYTLYWTYSTAKQLDEGTDQSLIPVLGFVPVLNLFTFWQISNAGEAVTDQSNVVLFLLFLIFAPLSWFWVQSGINAVAAE